MDAFLLGAILGYIVQNNLENKTFIEERTSNFEDIKQYLFKISVPDFAKKSGISMDLIIQTATVIAKAKSVSTHH